MIPKYGPDTPYNGSPYEPIGDSTKVVNVTAEDIVHGDGQSTLVMAIRLGLDPDNKGANLTLSQAIPSKFIEFLRTKDTEAILRNHIADYLHDIAEQWRRGEIFKR